MTLTQSMEEIANLEVGDAVMGKVSTIIIMMLFMVFIVKNIMVIVTKMMTMMILQCKGLMSYGSCKPSCRDSQMPDRW